MSDLPTEESLDLTLGTLNTKSYYELLGVIQSAQSTEIQSAFHSFSRLYHPDAHRGQPDRVRDKARTIFERGAEAYGVLRMAKRRSDYDLTLARGRLRLGEVGEDAPKPSGQKSLEDVCRSPGAKMLARQATRAISDGKLREAMELTRRALWAEGKNPELHERLRALEDFVKMGAG